MTTQRELIDACNLLCDFVAKNLPANWTIELTMNKEDASLSLIDAMADEHECEHDAGVSMISAMCDTANEAERRWQTKREKARIQAGLQGGAP